LAVMAQSFDSKHTDLIHDAQMDYYGKRLATCSSDKTIKIFEINKGGVPVETAQLVGHDGPVWQISWAHPRWGSIIASCSYDRKVIVWKEEKPKQWQKLHEYAGHELSVNSIAWAPQELGLVLAVASSDGHVSVLHWSGGSKWDIAKFLAHPSGVNSISWSPVLVPGSLFVQKQGPETGFIPRLVTGGCDNLVKIWRRNSNEWQKEPEAKLTGHTDWVRDTAWAPSLGLSTSLIASCSQDQKVIIWEGTPGEGDTILWNNGTVLAHEFNAPVWKVSWSVTGNILAVSSGDNKVTLWKETDKQWVKLTEMNESPSTGGN